jgi:tRNA modification GTPase
MGGHDAPVEGIIITHVRHKNVLVRTREALCQGVEAIEKGLSEELVAVDIREALSILGEITGETTTEEVLDIIFTNFCIGK